MKNQQLIDDINAAKVPPGECAYWWIGQHSFIVKLGETVVYIDPFLSDFPGRLVPPMLRPADVTNAQVVLGSHDHADHIDHGALPGILQASPGAKLIMPELLREKIVGELKLNPSQVIGIDAGRSEGVAGLKITAVPAAHEFLEVDEKTGLHPYLGFVIEGNGFCIYHAGDTCIYEGMQAILRNWKFDLAFLPINGRDARRFAMGCIGNMTFQEAADLAGALRPGLTVPAHYEMFEVNKEDPRNFIEYMQVKYPHLRTEIAVVGERGMVKTMNAKR